MHRRCLSGCQRSVWRPDVIDYAVPSPRTARGVRCNQTVCVRGAWLCAATSRLLRSPDEDIGSSFCGVNRHVGLIDVLAESAISQAAANCLSGNRSER